MNQIFKLKKKVKLMQVIELENGIETNVDLQALNKFNIAHKAQLKAFLEKILEELGTLKEGHLSELIETPKK